MITAIWFSALVSVASSHHANAASVLQHSGGGDPTALPAAEQAHPERAALTAGMWWADFDEDGLNDAYAIALTGACRLLRNAGDGTFQDVTLQAGLGAIRSPSLAVWNDYDKDGDPDLYLGSSVLMQNNGDGTFQDVSAHVGIGHAGQDLGAEWVDYDRDGHVDLFVRTNAGDHVYHALANGGFETVDLGLPQVPQLPQFSTGEGVSAQGAEETETVPAKRPAPTVRHVLSSGETVPVSTGGAPPPESGSSPGNGGVGPFGFALPICADLIIDQTSLACIEADSTPTIGRLYPLSADFTLDPATGNVLIGTATLRGSGSGGLMTVLNNVGATVWAIGGGGSFIGRNGAGVLTVNLDNDSSGSGRLELSALDDEVTVVLDADAGSGGGVLAVRSSIGNTTAVLDGESDNSGGRVGVFNNSSAETVRIIGDRLSSNSGGMTLIDRNGTSQSSIVMEAEDDFVTGSQIRLEGTTAGTPTIEIDGSDGSVGQIDIREVDGSVAFRFLTSTLTLRDAAGSITQSYNRLTGTKSAVVGTPSYGRRMLYVLESPEIWFEDFGSAELKNGQARVDVDPMFLETITVNEQYPMKVFVTLNGDCNGVFVEKGRDHFVVRELRGGTSSASFDWRLVAKRRGLETARLDDWAAQEAAMLEGTDAAVSVQRTAQEVDRANERGNP